MADDVNAIFNQFVHGSAGTATAGGEETASPATGPLAPLARVLEGFRVPGAFVGAAARDLQGATKGNVGKLAHALTPDITKGIVGTPGYYDRAHQALDEYYATDKPNLTAVQKGGGALGTVADAALHHPLVTGAVTFGAELANPLNFIAGPLGEAAGAGARGLRAAIPAVDRAATAVEKVGNKITTPIANAVGSVTNKFHGVGKASPGTGEGWARGADFTAQSLPHGIAQEHTEDVFGPHLPKTMNPLQRALESATAGVSQETKREIWRRAERDGEGQAVNAPREVAEPKYGPSVQERSDKLYSLIGAPVMSDAYKAAKASLDPQGQLLLDKMIQSTVQGKPRPAQMPKALVVALPEVDAALKDPFASIGSLTLKQMQHVPGFESRAGYLPMKMYQNRPVYGFQNAEDAASAKGGWPRSGFGVTRSKGKVLQGSLDDLEQRAQAQGGGQAAETPSLYRYQREAGEPVSTPRGGTFFSAKGRADETGLGGEGEEPLGERYKTSTTYGGSNRLDRVPAARKPAVLSDDDMVFDDSLSRSFLFKALGEDEYSTVADELRQVKQTGDTGPVDQRLRVLGVSPADIKALHDYGDSLIGKGHGFNTVGDMKDRLYSERLAAEYAKAAGYDAISSPGEYFSLSPNAVRAPRPAAPGGGQLFSDKFDPAFQLYNYARNAESNVAKAQAVKGLANVPTATGPARVDLNYHLPNQPENPIPGPGPEAAARAKNFATRRSTEALRARAANEIGRPDLAGSQRGLLGVASTFGKFLEAQRAARAAKGIVPGVQDAAGRAGAAADPSAAFQQFRAAGAKYRTPGGTPTSPELERALAAKRAGQHVPAGVIPQLRAAALKTANDAANATGTLGHALYGNQGRVIKAVDRGVGKVEQSADRFAARRDQLETQYHSATATAADRAEIERRVAGGLAAEVQRTMSSMGGRVPKGYVAESDLRLGLGADSQGRAIQQDFATYLQDAQKAGALPEDAEGVARVLATLNGLARRMMVLVPTVHTVWNLGLGFLSAGGRPDEMGRALAGQVGPDYLGPQLEQRFMRSGAASAMSSGSTIGKVRNATTPLSELDPRKATGVGDFFERLGAAGHKITDATVTGPDSRYVFDTVENGYARVLFKRLTSQGLSDGAAAKRIRSVLGDYNNITSAEKPLQNLFFFYPWMKTAITHWTKELASQPGPFFNAPMQGIRANNEIQGDVDDGQVPRSPFSLTLGKTPQGDFRRLALPLPQRYANDVAGMVLGNGDTKANGLYQRTEPITNLLRGHLNPVAGTIADAVLPGQSKYQRINIDTKDPTPPAQQVAGQVAGRFLPPVQSIGQNLSDPLGAVAGEAGLGFPSAHLSKGERARQEAITRAYAPAIKAAQQAGDAAEAKRLYLQLQADIRARPTVPQ